MQAQMHEGARSCLFLDDGGLQRGGDRRKGAAVFGAGP